MGEACPPKLKPLLQLVQNPKKLKGFQKWPVSFFDPQLQEETKENESQRQAVVWAMSTPDVALIKGPPGTGKTTVICEIALQHITKGQKVLIVAPTHIAVDKCVREDWANAGSLSSPVGACQSYRR